MGYSRFFKFRHLLLSILAPILILSSIQSVYATTLNDSLSSDGSDALEANQANTLEEDLVTMLHQQESSALTKAFSIQASIDVLKNAIDQDNLDIEQHKKTIERLDVEQQELIEQQKQDTETLGNYISTQYTEGDTPYLTYISWLVSSTSMGDLVNRYHYVDTVLSFYRDLKETIAENSAVIKAKQSLAQDEVNKLTEKVQSNQQLLDGLNVALAKQTSLITSLTQGELEILQTQSRGQQDITDTQRLIAAEQLQSQPSALAKYLQILASQQKADGLQGSISTPVKLNGSVGQLLSFAATFLGVPYTWGGTYPQFDCSSYVQYVYGHFGIYLHRVTWDQYGQGQNVSREQLVPGDLVFFSTYLPGPSHVGIYVGNGIMINSSNSGVSYASINSPYWSSRYYGARRVIQ